MKVFDICYLRPFTVTPFAKLTALHYCVKYTSANCSLQVCDDSSSFVSVFKMNTDRTDIRELQHSLSMLYYGIMGFIAIMFAALLFICLRELARGLIRK